MTPTPYTEDTLVKQTTAEYLEQELGWESVYAYNNEDFGPNSLLGRESDREVVLTRTLRAKIEELNSGLPAKAYDDAVRQIVTVSASQTMAATNREKYELIKDGVQVTFRNTKGERVRKRLRVFDFEVPENNHFLCVRELWVRGDLYRRRADIVGFVNGLNEGKNNGMIVDYCGILKNLRKALATFAGTGDDGRGGNGGETEPAKPDEELLADLAEAIETQTGLAVSGILPHTAFVHPWTAAVAEELPPYDISKIDFNRLRREFERSPAKRTTVQNLKSAIEQRLQRLLRQNPLCTDFQRHYQEIVSEYNREKDRVTIEKTFEALLQIMDEMDNEESRAVREGLDEESLPVFDLLRKPDLTSGDIKRIKAVAVDLLENLKAEKLRINHWRDKESTRDAVRLTIQDYLWSEQTGLPETYSEEDVRDKTEAVFVHVFRAYPTVPSPYYASMAS